MADTTQDFWQNETAVRQLLARQPEHVGAMFRLSILCIQSNRLGEAEQLLRHAMELQPNSVDVLNMLAVLLANTSRKPEAIPLLRRAIAIRPAPEFHNNLANALREAKQYDEAIFEYQQALALRPDYLEALMRLASLMSELRRWDDAVAVQRRCVAVAPQQAETHCNLACALRAAGNYSEAETTARKSIEINPELHEAHVALGDILQAQEKFDESVTAYRRALTLRGNSAPAHRGLGNALFTMDRVDESIMELADALRLEPAYADTHWDYAVALLKAGRLSDAWPEFEWRHRKSIPNIPRDIGKPRWNGEPLNGRTIFLQGEQAFGDRIQFIRYAPLVARAGGKVIIDTLPELVRLFQGIDGVHQVVTGNDEIQADLCCPVMSLPLVFKTTLPTIPTPPYLKANEELVREWADRLGPPSGNIRVGLVWAGRPKPDPARSIPLETLAPILAMEKVEFISLQTGDSAAQLGSSSLGKVIRNFTAELTDFAETAALMSQLDLIITIDTAAAHLAGALGRPVWVLLKHHADYRWMVGREDSPWYPGMKLFRQSQPGDWTPVVARVLEQLGMMIQL